MNGGVIAALMAEEECASAASVTGGNMVDWQTIIDSNQKVFHWCFDYQVGSGEHDGEILIEIIKTFSYKKTKFFGGEEIEQEKKETGWLPLAQGLKENLPAGSFVINLVFDWYNEVVEVFYLSPKTKNQ